MRVNYADKTKTAASAAIGFEAQLWAAADKTRRHLQAAESNAIALRDSLPPNLRGGKLSPNLTK